MADGRASSIISVRSRAAAVYTMLWAHAQRGHFSIRTRGNRHIPVIDSAIGAQPADGRTYNAWTYAWVHLLSCDWRRDERKWFKKSTSKTRLCFSLSLNGRLLEATSHQTPTYRRSLQVKGQPKSRGPGLVGRSYTLVAVPDKDLLYTKQSC